MERKLYLSTRNKKIGGVCGGLSEYFGIDATIIRLIFIGAVIFHGMGLLAYFAAWAIMPKYKEDKAPIF